MLNIDGFKLSSTDTFPFPARLNKLKISTDSVIIPADITEESSTEVTFKMLSALRDMANVCPSSVGVAMNMLSQIKGFQQTQEIRSHSIRCVINMKIKVTNDHK